MRLINYIFLKFIFCCYIRQNPKYYKYCCGTATCELTLWIFNQLATSLFTAQCTLVQDAVLRSHVVRLSVRLSVTLMDCDHIGWKSWKPIARTISPTTSLFIAKRRSTYFHGNVGKLWGEWRWGMEKWRDGEQKRQYV